MFTLKRTLTAAVLLGAAAWTPAGVQVQYDLEGTIFGTLNGEPIEGVYIGGILLGADFSAQLNLIALPAIAGTWKETGEFTESANFTDGIETAFETVSGQPAKVDYYKFTKMVRTNGFLGASVKAKFKWVAPKLGKGKFKWKGFVGGVEPP